MSYTFHNESENNMENKIGHSSGFGNSRSAGEDVAGGPSPMVDGFPCNNRPNFILAGYPRA